MTESVLLGVRSDSMLGYMKAIGILRVLAEQVDRDVRGSWNDTAFVLHAELTRAELERFFLDRYQPLPVFNPWNSGAGFDAKSKSQAAGRTLDAVAATGDPRWEQCRAVLHIARVVSMQFENGRTGDSKQAILEALRERYPDDALRWLDAAVVVGRKELDFPRLLGTGGNDGRLDFSVNFLQRALDVVGPNAVSDRETLLRDALDGTSNGRLGADVAIGQYAPASAGGANATVGFDAVSLVNPWDFVLLIEGIVVFAGSITKRFSATRGRAAFPFTFAPTAAGYGAASAAEEKRAEIWLPRWRGAATFRAVTQLVRTARVDVETSTDPRRPSPRAATSGIEAAQAALSRGVASGIQRFERVVIAQRNGLAFSAVRVGVVPADAGFTAAAALSREATRWVNRLRGKTLNPPSAEALQAYDDAMFAYAEHPISTSLLQEWLAALGGLDVAVGRARLEGIQPFGFRDGASAQAIARDLDDGSYEHALAAGFASIGFGSVSTRMRLDVAPVVADRSSFAYDEEHAARPALLPLLASSATRRLREARADHGYARLRGNQTARVALDAVSAFLDGTVDDRRLGRLLAGYVLLPPVPVTPGRNGSGDVPIAWAAMKLLFDGFEPAYRAELASEVPVLLLSDRTPDALKRAYLNMTVALLSAPWPLNERRSRDFRFADLDHPQRAVAALLLPITLTAREELAERVLQTEGFR